MIKQIEPSDVKSVIYLGERFYKEGNLPGSFVPEIAEANWVKFITAGFGKIFAYYSDDVPVGAIGIFVANDVNDGELIAEEAFWFVSQEHRGIGIKLLAHAENFARELGCKRMAMIHLVDLYPEKLKHLYERRGYRCVEHAYHRSL